MEELLVCIMWVIAGWSVILINLVCLTVEKKVNYPRKIVAPLVLSLFPIIGTALVVFTIRSMLKDNWKFD